jgi:putative transposase
MDNVSPPPLEGSLRKCRYTEEQIIFALKEREAGKTTVQICRKLGVSEQTFYRWKAKFGGMDVADAKRLKGLEEENRKLKQLAGELSLDNQSLSSPAGSLTSGATSEGSGTTSSSQGSPCRMAPAKASTGAFGMSA